MLDTTTPRLWFDRAISVLNLPRWPGMLLVGLVPAAALWAWGIDTRIATDFTGVPAISLPLLLTNVAFLLWASQLVRARTLQLRDYTLSLGGGAISDRTGLFSSWRPIVGIWVVLVLATSIVFDPVVFNLYYSPFQELQRVFVTSYLRLIQATFLWVLGCAMYLIYKWGRLPIKLKSFTEDRMLGLNVYGRASLLFVSLYIVAMLLTFPVFVYKSQAIVLSEVVFSLLGLLMFLGPLFSLRRKLVEAKGEKLAWIQRRHSRVIESIESAGDGPIDQALVSELIAIDRIRSDLQRISGWPFNAGVVAKLITVVLLPLSLYVLCTYLVHVLNF